MSTIRAAFSRSREYDHLAGALTTRRPGSRGPIPQYTEELRPSVTPEMARRVRRIAKSRNKTVSALVREVLEIWLKANEEVA